MKKNVVIGIDPGLSGAMAVIDLDGILMVVYDTPTILTLNGKRKKRSYCLSLMSEYLREWAERCAYAGVENVHAWPGEGVNSAFCLGEGRMAWEAILSTLKYKYQMVEPTVWKRVMVGWGKDKGASIAAAQKMHPSAPLHLKKHHGRADAILIAEFILRLWRGSQIPQNKVEAPG